MCGWGIWFGVGASAVEDTQKSQQKKSWKGCGGAACSSEGRKAVKAALGEKRHTGLQDAHETSDPLHL